MRLWHKNLIEVLPKQQLTGQWLECSIAVNNIIENKLPGNLIVNKVLDYPISDLIDYVKLVYNEMLRRNYKPSMELVEKCFKMPASCFKDSCVIKEKRIIFENWHNERYLRQCYHNLQEKYDCGGIKKEDWEKIERHVSMLLRKKG